MKEKTTLSHFEILTKSILLVLITILFSCSNEEENISVNSSYTVTVGVYFFNGIDYEDQNKDLVYVTQEDCQYWTRMAPPDTHSAVSHDHYNAAKNTTYDSSSGSLSWVEYGPELDQPSIENVCQQGTGGVTKSANTNEFTSVQNFYLKIKSVVEN